MDDYQPGTFGQRFADVYDDITKRGDEEEASTLLAELAGEGRALELAIGTGRIALPLAARGVRVDGIDISLEMVAKLRGKPGGDAISVTMGNFADVGVEGSYELIFLVFNALFNLTTQEEQVRCFENVARHLTETGSFVVEASVPDISRFQNGQSIRTEGIKMDEVVLDVCQHDAANQRIDESHVFLSPAGIRLYPVVTRYAWPSELDLMARIASLRLKHRWSDWKRHPFTKSSKSHISVYSR